MCGALSGNPGTPSKTTDANLECVSVKNTLDYVVPKMGGVPFRTHKPPPLPHNTPLYQTWKKGFQLKNYCLFDIGSQRFAPKFCAIPVEQ